MLVKPINTAKTLINNSNSIRKMFYNGTTTLEDMSKDRVQATIYDAVRFLARKYEKMWLPFRLVLRVKKPEIIEKEIIPKVVNEFENMDKNEFSKLQKALVIIENPKGKKKQLYADSIDFYSNIVTRILNKIVF